MRLGQRLRRVGERAWGLHADVEGNARILVITEGVSAIAFQWYGTYLPLYMLALGVSELQVGLLASVLLAAQFASTLLGGYYADRFGRKRMLVWSDILFWGTPMLLYAIAQNPWYFLAGRLINGFVYVVSPSFECMFVEDVPAERRAAVFGMLRFWYAFASLFAPVAGALVDRLGMVTAGRAIMWTTMVVAVGTAIYRQFSMRETQMGRQRMAAVAGAAGLTVLGDYARTVMVMYRNRQTAVFLGVRIMVSFVTTMWTTYATIYLTDTRGIGLPKSAVALLPFVSALTTIAIIILVADRIRSGSQRANLIAGQILWLAGTASFFLSPPGTITLALLWTGLAAISSALFQPALQSYWANIVDDRSRAQMAAAAGALVALGSLPAGPVAGLLYVTNPRFPFALAIAMQVLVLGMVLGLRQASQAAPVNAQGEPSLSSD